MNADKELQAKHSVILWNLVPKFCIRCVDFLEEEEESKEDGAKGKGIHGSE